MSENEIKNLQMQIDDIKWYQKLKGMPLGAKIEEVLAYCPCCIARIRKSLWYFSDQELNSRLITLEAELTNQINIDDVYEK